MRQRHVQKPCVHNNYEVPLKAIMYNCQVNGVEEITPEQSSLSLTTSLKLSITQMHDRGFGLIGPRQVHVETPHAPDEAQLGRNRGRAFE